MGSSQQQAHSAEYLGEHREYWWNSDFLELMAKRWELQNIHSVLDVGCGVGHWSMALSNYLPADTQITGIDREREWIEKARERTKNEKDRFKYRVSKAEAIPFPENSFDMVTCQTLLLHVHDVRKVLEEMIRVLKPGGLLVVAEPNNSITEIVFDTVSVNEPLDDTLKAIQFCLTCERGQQLMGRGFSSIGDIIPGYLQEFHLANIQIYLSDKTSPLFPPYEDSEQQSYIKLLKEWYEAELFIWDKRDTKKYFLAGGGTAKQFEELWSFMKERFKKRIEAIDSQSYSTSGGCLLYLISGRKP